MEDDEVVEETKPKRRGLPDAVVEMDLPWEPERYDMDGCGITLRDGSDVYPFEGQSVWLSPYTPTSLTEAGMGFTASGSDRMADSFAMLRRGLSKVVAYHDLTDPNTGEPFEQWWQNADALDDVPSPVLFYVWNLAVTGEPPDARPKGSSRGSRGTSTRNTTARRSRS